MRDSGSGIQDQGFRIRIQDQGLGMSDSGSGIRDERFRKKAGS
jgi:hypothetical protein